LLEENRAEFTDRGFERLLGQGIYYRDAHYEHANTETIVGHATLATGAHPASHGMTGNVWYDRASGELAYNIEDPDHPILPSRPTIRSGDQVDPAQLLARTDGRSPRSLLAETTADVIAKSTANASGIYAVSGKDRSAVAMAGKAGKAFWFSSNTGDFVTSTFYYDTYPEWVRAWNGKRSAESHAGSTWSLREPLSSYRNGLNDDRPFETDLRGYGRTFPHRFGGAEDGLLPTQLIASPLGDRLLADFAGDLIDHEGLGKDEAVDYLSVSFSGIDAVNHFFGPASLETEVAILELDRTIGEFLALIDRAVGLAHVLLILSADHGASEMPEAMKALGFDSDRLYPNLVIERANAFARKLWGLEDVVRFYYRPYLYLDHEKIGSAGLDFPAVSGEIAQALTNTNGIELAITPLQLTSAAESRLIRQIRNNYHPTRSGDIYVVQSPYWFNFDKGPVAAMHGSPWNYDTHVPIVFAGPGIEKRSIHRRIQPVAVAPTVAALLGLTAPASSVGEVLSEVLVRAQSDNLDD
jgi:predicted AlkP superfamily pyrophosphatase or phosphodiesterase